MGRQGTDQDATDQGQPSTRERWFGQTFAHRLSKQLSHLKWLQSRGLNSLRRLHQDKFTGTPWWIKLPGHFPREAFIKRLFCLHCHSYPLHPPGELQDSTLVALERRMAPNAVAELRREDEARQHVKEFERFSRENISTMSPEDVDRYLAALNIAIPGAALVDRQQALWEMFNKPQTELIALNNRKGERTKRRQGRIPIRSALAQLILQNPTMDYSSFVNTYGKVFPTVTAGAYRQARYVLRLDGNDLPRFDPGPEKIPDRHEIRPTS